MIGAALKAVASFFFDNPLGKFVALAALITSLVVGFAYDQRSVGAVKATAKMETENAKSTALAEKSRSGSRNSNVGGVLDPYIRAE